ncbi:MAG: BACON domain-containing protein [Prevotella sp.]|jgi:hypothetical protein|nr:BACON domain-containing protein [Prevotella sp.]
MKRINNITAGFLLLAAIILSGTSCREEICETVSNPGEKEVTIHLALPADLKAAPGSTYLSEVAERAITGVTVLAFVKDASTTGQGKFYFRDSYAGTNIDQSLINGTEAPAAFKVKLKPYFSSDQRLVILANYAPPATITVGMELGEALEKMTVDETNGGWDDTRLVLPMAAVTGPISIPIEAETATIGALGGLITSPIQMIRMLARINVTLGSNVDTDKFELESACIYNRKTKGFVSYKALDSEYWDGSGTVKKAWVPSGTNVLTPTKSYGITGANAIERSIYTFEAGGVTGVANKKDATAIIVGGKYEGVSGFYRVDIAADGKPSAGAYGEILRNHSYNIVIQKVEHAGAPDAESAFYGVVSVTASVSVWDLINAPVVIDNNQLKISKTQLRYDGVGTKSRSVTVTVSDGVAWTASTSTVWITNSSGTGADASTGTREIGSGTGAGSLAFKVNACSSGTRNGTITVTAGNITKTINVFQYGKAAVILSSNTGKGTAVGAKTFTVSHMAPWSAVTTTTVPTGWLLWTTGATYTNPTGVYSYSTATSTTATFYKSTTVTTPSSINIKFSCIPDSTGDMEFDDINTTLSW